jgi:hypothetical protein
MTGQQPPPFAFSSNTGKSLQTHGTPCQSDSNKGSPQPSAIVGKTLARASAYNLATTASLAAA